jgi:hypothetical protein
MVDLKWIIEKENELLDKARFNLGDNYYFSLDLLPMFQELKTMSISNEVAFFFESEIMTNLYLAFLNTIRRHTITASFNIRLALESLVLFAYSMDFSKKSHYGIVEENEFIISFDDKILTKAYDHIEKNYPSQSKEIESYKSIINTFYSHANISSAQNNALIKDGAIKATFFDNYTDEYIREYLSFINNLMCSIFDFYLVLQKKYASFYFNDGFEEKLTQHKKRNEKLLADQLSKYDENRKDPMVDKIIEKINKKYPEA